MQVIPTSWSTLDSALSRAEEAPRAAAGVAVDGDTEGYHRTTAIVRERAINQATGALAPARSLRPDVAAVVEREAIQL